MIVNINNFNEIVSKLQDQVMLVIDVETSGFNILDDDFICGIGISIADRSTYYFPFRHTDEGNLSIELLPELLDSFKSKTLIGHNIKFDIKALFKDGFDYYDCKLIDIMVMARLCSLKRYPLFSLDKVAEEFISVERGAYKNKNEKFLKSSKYVKFSDAPIEVIGEYCCKDVELEHDLYLILHNGIVITNQEQVWELDIETTKTLIDMEITGITVDLEYCKNSVDLLIKNSSIVENDIYELVGKEFNINSHKQLSEIMASLHIVSPLKTKHGESWSQPALVQLDNIPICKKLIEYRGIGTLKNTFFEPILEKNKQVIHTSFKNWKTITGRLSCEQPNLQNIPVFAKDFSVEANLESTGDEVLDVARRNAKLGGGGRSASFTEIDENADNLLQVSARKLFISRNGASLFSFDISQMEVVVLLFYSKEYELLQKISSGDFDFHIFVAIEALGADKESPNFKLIRDIAKSITFGVLYGMGLNSLAIRIGKSRQEAVILKDKYFKRMPKAKKFIDDILEKAKNGEPISNIYGRRYYILKNEAYKIVNYMIQGTAGEIIKERMNEIAKFLHPFKSRMLLQIHDELIIEIYEDEEYLIPNLVDILSNTSLGFKLKIDVAKCKNDWASKEKYEFSFAK